MEATGPAQHLMTRKEAVEGDEGEKRGFSLDFAQLQTQYWNSVPGCQRPESPAASRVSVSHVLGVSFLHAQPLLPKKNQGRESGSRTQQTELQVFR